MAKQPKRNTTEPIRLKVGRRPVLQWNAAMKKKLENHGRTAMGIGRSAKLLGVAEDTLRLFLQRNPEAQEAWDYGEAAVDQALFSKQIELALKGDKLMLIWLGKQRLGQKDKVEHASDPEHPGPTMDSKVIFEIIRPPPIPDKYADFRAHVKDIAT